MIYYALVKGRGDGCDYTIGCNLTWTRLKAVSLEQAKMEAITNYPPSIDRDFGTDIESILILGVVDEANLAIELDARRAETHAEKKKAEQAKKRAEFERLKRELGQ